MYHHSGGPACFLSVWNIKKCAGFTRSNAGASTCGVTEWCGRVVWQSGVIEWCDRVVWQSGVAEWCDRVVWQSGVLRSAGAMQ